MPKNQHLYTKFYKKDGGVRPIAIGCTLRRLVAKCACSQICNDMSAILSPLQLGYGTPRGAEAVVHAARTYLSSMDNSHLLLKLDFQNTFNSIRRDKMMMLLLEKAPTIFPFVHSSYSKPSFLFFGSSTIPSVEGVQQGDPLSPLPFCLSIHNLISNLKFEFKVFYLDDGTLGGN